MNEKKKPFRNELKQCGSKYVFLILVLKHHRKSNSFHFKQEGLIRRNL